MFTQLRHFIAALLALLLINVVEKGLFALYHTESLAGLDTEQIVYALAWGLRFDLAISAIFALLAYLAAYLGCRLLRLNFLSVLRLFTTLAAVTLVVLHGADMLYYEEAGRHLGYELKESFNSGGELALAAIGSYTATVMFQLLMLVPAVYLVRYLLAPSPDADLVTRRGLATELQLVAVTVAALLMIRGGIQSVPLEPLHAQEIGQSQQAAIALNGVYNAVFSSVTPYAVARIITTPPSSEDLAQVRKLYPRPAAAQVDSPQRYNIIMLFLESWSAAYMGSYGYEKVTTPYFDRLRGKSLTTTRMLAGGHRTTEGLFTTLCSAQNPLGQTIAQSQLQAYPYRCLPHQLQEQGYHSAFFQGSNKNTSGTGAFARQLGFRDSFGKADVSQRRYEENSWGLHDPDLYGFALDYIRRQEGPYLVGINTNSTHDRHLPPGISPAFAGEEKTDKYASALHFADQALQGFIETLEQEGRLNNTLVVIMADHCGMSYGPMQNRYSIPFLIYGPGIVTPQWLDVTASQRDIAPTLQAILGLETLPGFTGQSLLDSNSTRFADYYHEGRMGWAQDNVAVEFPVKKPQQAACLDEHGRAAPHCNADQLKLVDNALAFTRLSQELLFSGRTGEFRAILDRPDVTIP